MNKKVLIVGGVAGGASTAARLRRLDENIEIIIFERGEYISFANCGLPYYIGEEIKDRANLLVQTPEKMKNRFNIDVRIKNEVLEIDRKNKKVKVKNIISGEVYDEVYDILVLSPGSSPIKPPIEGIDSPNVFSIWTLPDTDKIKEYVDNNKPRTAVVVGGGFIGIEMAENLKQRGVDVSLVELFDQVMQPLDYDMAQGVHKELKANGIKLFLGDGVKSFKYNDKSTTVELASGRKIEADIVIMSAGIKPNGELAAKSGLKVNQRGGIVVDKYLRTDDSSIYALGDAAETTDFIDGFPKMVPLAGPANKQGRIVANNIVGKSEEYKGTQGTSIVKVFDLTVAATGHNEKVLQKKGLNLNVDYKVTVIQAKSHAGYYPGASSMTIKMIFDMKGKVLGAQIIGYDGVDKRIDVIATAIRFEATIYDLMEIEHAYAPPYSSAKDPVNMLGFTAENLLNGTVENILPSELNKEDRENILILDIRDEFELAVGKVEGSVNIPLDRLRSRMNEIDKSKTIIPYCAAGLRSYVAARILSQNGFKVKNLAGGLPYYEQYFGKFTVNGTEDNNIDNNNRGNKENITSEEKGGSMAIDTNNVVRIDACGLQCPGPILKVYNKMNEINNGDVLEVSATDPGFIEDAKSWAANTGNTFIKSEKKDKEYLAWIKKGLDSNNVTQVNTTTETLGKDKTLVVFSGELDKAMASFIIANGAAAMGKKVTMFFTFWGLNILRRPERVKLKKTFMEKMFGFMMPRGASKLGLSKMNMAGMGGKMMRMIMKKKNVDTLEDLIRVAQENGIRIVACTMSMDVMGIKKEELIDGIEYAGVATYLGAAEQSNLNLFV